MLPRFEQFGTEGFCFCAAALAVAFALELDFEVIVLSVELLRLTGAMDLEEELELIDEIIVMVDLGAGSDVIALVANMIGELDVLIIEDVAVAGATGCIVPVVFVTTATLQSACMPSPIRNRPTMDCGFTETPLHAVVTCPFVCIRPFRQLWEHTYGGSKSPATQPGMAARYAASQAAGRPCNSGMKSAREIAWAREEKARKVARGKNIRRMLNYLDLYYGRQ